MPTVTGSGTLTLPAFEISGTGSILSPDAGTNTRQSTITFDISFQGNYFDEIDGILNDSFPWKADGLKYSNRTGTGEGQSNRFWYVRGLEIEYQQHVDLDLYSFLSIDAGKGFGQDQLGLGIIMNEITFLMIRNKTNGSVLEVGGASVAPWTSLLQGTFVIQPGDRFLFQTQNASAPAVTQGSSQYLRLAPQGDTCTVDIFVAGRYTSIS